MLIELDLGLQKHIAFCPDEKPNLRKNLDRGSKPVSDHSFVKLFAGILRAKRRLIVFPAFS
jgi:hypothetical protein